MAYTYCHMENIQGCDGGGWTLVMKIVLHSSLGVHIVNTLGCHLESKFVILRKSTCYHLKWIFRGPTSRYHGVSLNKTVLFTRFQKASKKRR